MTAQRGIHRGDVADACIAIAFYALSVALVVDLMDTTAKRVVGAAIAFVHVAPLAVRRRWPVAVVGVMACAAVASVVAHVPVVALGPGVIVALYTAGGHTDRRTSQPLLGVVVIVMAGVVFFNGADMGTIVSNAVVLGLAWWLGDRSRRVALGADEERAAAADAVRRAALDERMRIARELHDVVAHSMTVIAVKAGAARFAAETSDPEVAESLAAIEQTSRAALDEMRRLVTVLRDEHATGELGPAPGLEAIDELVATARDAGVEVEVERCGTARALPAGVDLCAFRIVQEALTNVCKHAQARRAVVRLAFDADGLALEVSDDGLGAAAVQRSGPGHGLVGMHERVALYGGEFEAGPVGHGYRVRARLPIGALS